MASDPYANKFAKNISLIGESSLSVDQQMKLWQLNPPDKASFSSSNPAKVVKPKYKPHDPRLFYGLYDKSQKPSSSSYQLDCGKSVRKTKERERIGYYMSTNIEKPKNSAQKKD